MTNSKFSDAAAPRIDPALVVVLAGVTAALHVGKLPPALPALREALGITLVQAGFLLSLVQMAGMTLGLVIGSATDSFGLRRSMTAGLVTLGLASLCGGFAENASVLLILRAIEGLGMLLILTPAPGLIRRLVAPQRRDVMLSLWATYMPFGTAVALLAGPWLIQWLNWPAWWWTLSLLALAMAAWLWTSLPPDERTPGADHGGWAGRLRLTLSSRGPWLLALMFATYSAQWLGVVGFLPSVYAQAGLGGKLAGALTAAVAAANMVGNIVAGRLLQRGVPAPLLLSAGFAAMALGAALTFMPTLDAGATARYLGVLMFSMVGGMIPATLFALSVRLAPDTHTVSTTVGWMQQLSALGQFSGPPLLAWVASRVGDWSWTWAVTGSFCLAGILISSRIAVLLRQRC
jgi:MFS family permease